MRIIAAFFVLLASSAPCWSQTKIEVRIKGTPVAQSVGLSRDADSFHSDLVLDPNSGVFSATVSQDSPEATVVQPYDLVISWGDANENVFLNIGPLSPERIRIDVDAFVSQTTFKLRDLSAIEALGSDDGSMLKKYFFARRFHRHWRGRGVVDNEISLRSARIWLDASVNLVKRRPYTFRLDSEISEILGDYKARSRTDDGLAERVRKYFPAALVTSAQAEVIAAPYVLVAKIPSLLRQNRLQEAYEYNQIAIRSFESSSPEDRVAITAKQGVNQEMLLKNDAYILALLQRSGESPDGPL